MNLRPEQRCEAVITRRTVREPITRIVSDFEGRDHDLGPDIKEQTGLKEASITCQRCSIAQTIQAEGEGPYGHINALNEKRRELLADVCQKFRSFKPTPTGSWDDSMKLERASEEYFKER